MDDKSLTVQEEKTSTELSVTSKYGAVAAQISNEDLEKQMIFDTKRRELLKNYIQYHLVRGYDYGKIHIVKDCPNKYDCKILGHYSKYILLKPGQEKVMSLLHWISDFKIDSETRAVFGDDKSLVAYICIIYDFNGQFVAQGKGAASLIEVSGNHNNCIKKAKKRAQADALLSSGVLSDFLSVIEQEPTKQTTEAAPTVRTINCTCATKGDFHSRTCPEWRDPKTVDLDKNEIVNAESVDVDSLPEEF